MGTQESRKEVLFDSVLSAKKCEETKRSLANLMLRFPLYADANHELSDMIESETDFNTFMFSVKKD